MNFSESYRVFEMDVLEYDTDIPAIPTELYHYLHNDYSDNVPVVCKMDSEYFLVKPEDGVPKNTLLIPWEVSQKVSEVFVLKGKYAENILHRFQ